MSPTHKLLTVLLLAALAAGGAPGWSSEPFGWSSEPFGGSREPFGGSSEPFGGSRGALGELGGAADEAFGVSAAQAAGIAFAVHTPHVKPRTTLPIIERQVMCVTCKIPLMVAESPQAKLEREYIQGLINKGQGEAEVKRSLVAQYGPTVLGLPSTHGFDLAAYLVPLAVVLALLATLAVVLPRWRRHTRTQTAIASPAVARLSPADAARLESDLAHFD